jgi:hypothetical protein
MWRFLLSIRSTIESLWRNSLRQAAVGDKPRHEVEADDVEAAQSPLIVRLCNPALLSCFAADV